MLFEEPVEQAEKVLVRFHQNLETLDEVDLAAVEHKRKLYAELATSPEYQCIKEASDLWTGAFFAPKSKESLQSLQAMSGGLWQERRNLNSPKVC